MKKFFLLFTFCLLSLDSFIFPQNRMLDTDWEGNWWSRNGNRGSWFPSFEDLATFSINDFSWGEIRSVNQISSGTSITIEAQIINSSAGVNYDAAFFGIGDGWIHYEGNTYGLVFRDGVVQFFEHSGNQNTTFKDTIGTYVIGEMINFTFTFNNDGSLNAQGDNFSGTFTPTTVVQNAKLIIASKDSEQNQGFYLKSIDGVQITTIEDETVESSIKDYSLSQNYPNPFNPSTTINYSVPGASNVKIMVYDINGQVVKNLLSEFKKSGSYSLNWDGTNDSGSKVSSGTYFYQVQIGNLVQTKKMILLK